MSRDSDLKTEPLFYFAKKITMADLFEDSGGSGGEAADSPSPAKLPTTNGHGLLEDPSPQDVESFSASAENGLGEEEEEEDAEKDGEYTERGSRDDIKVSVLRYQKTADDFTFDVEASISVLHIFILWVGLSCQRA